MKSRAGILAQVSRPRKLIFLLSMLILILSACGGGGGTSPTGGGGLNTGGGTSGSNEIKLGALYIGSGPLASLGQDALRGVQMAIDEFHGTVAGKKIVLSKETSDATPNVARDAARKLIENDGVDLMVGPLSGDEGLAVAFHLRGAVGSLRGVVRHLYESRIREEGGAREMVDAEVDGRLEDEHDAHAVGVGVYLDAHIFELALGLDGSGGLVHFVF